MYIYNQSAVIPHMRAQTTSDFLRDKALNMRETLLNDHKANPTAMAIVMATFFNDDCADDVSKYACQLRGQCIHDVAKRMTSYLECPDETKAAACIRKYLECFQSVTDGFTY